MHWNREKLAAELGVSLITIIRYESGISFPKSEIIKNKLNELIENSKMVNRRKKIAKTQ